MNDTETEWPSQPWDLAAPESYVLRYGLEMSGSRPFRFAIVELIARGLLKLIHVTEPRLLRHARETTALIERGRPDSRLPQSLAAVWQLYRRAPFRTFEGAMQGVTVRDLAAALVDGYRTYYAFGVEEITPELIKRGLLTTKSERPFPWLFATTKYVPTPAGKEAAAELDRWITIGETEFADLVETNPRKAMAFSRVAGCALLLIEPGPAQMQALARFAQETGYLPADAGLLGLHPIDDRGEDRDAPGDGEPIATPAAAGLGILDIGNLANALDVGISAGFEGIFDPLDFVFGGDGGGGDGGSDGGGW